MTKIIAVANHKGGSGKTTTTYYLGLALAASGRNTLLIDFDDQATLTNKLYKAWTPGQTTIADVLDGMALATALCQYDVGLQYVPADHRLAWIAARMQASSPNHAFLRRAWQRANMQPEYVLIDCPPSAGVLLINALALADWVLIPATPTEESYAGVLRMQAMIQEIACTLNHPVKPLGIMATMVSPSSISEQKYLNLMGEMEIGRVPRRVGQTADAELRSTYAEVAKTVIRILESER
ncbi:ParA family protein [Caldilinea sp.]|jgi:chromosome partitioning protein|uniref:ParA family protein n=1 Tax=Caldilinea sp. TaxID=2293560 RepID=UPI00257F1E19|nr:ParA family protein [Caldilinea sp.]